MMTLAEITTVAAAVTTTVPEAASPSIHYSLEQVFSPYVPVFAVAWAVAMIATPVMRMLALRNGVVDLPDLRRKHHREPIAYLGGVALFLGWAAGVMVSLFLIPHTGVQTVPFPASMLAGAVVITIVGLVDDVYGSSPRVKIGGQLIASAMLAGNEIGTKLASGLIESVFDTLSLQTSIIPGFGHANHLLDPCYYVGTMIVVFLVVGACNATNLLDGLDGLLSGVTTITTIGFLFISVALAMGIYNGSAYSLINDPVRIVACLALIGALLGFLPYNFNPANIFMGDTGSLLLGYLSVCMVLLIGERGDTRLAMAALVVFALPITDTALAIIRRKSKGQPIFSPDNFHIHHQLVRAGFKVPFAVLILYAIALGFAVLGCSMIFIRLRFVALVFLVVMGFILVTAFKIGHRQYTAQLAAEEEAAGAAPPVFKADAAKSPADAERTRTSVTA